MPITPGADFGEPAVASYNPNAEWTADVKSDGTKGLYTRHSLGPQTLTIRFAGRWDLSPIVFAPGEEVLSATFGCNINGVTNVAAQSWNIFAYRVSGDESDPEADTGADMFGYCTGGHAMTDAPVTDFRTTGNKSIALNATALADINATINGGGSKKFALAIRMVDETGPNTWSQIDGYTLASPPTLTLVIGVPAVNEPPVANAGADQIVNEGDLVTLLGSGTDSDGTIASYAWVQTSGPTVSLSNPAVAQPTFTAPQVAVQQVLSFKLTVTDDDGATGEDFVNVTVNDVPEANLPPIANAGPDQTVNQGVQVQLTGAASSDPESQPLTYTWTQTEGPAVSLSDAAAQSLTFIAPSDLSADALLRFSLTVFDGVNTSAPDTVDVNVIVVNPTVSSNFEAVIGAELNKFYESNTVVVAGIGIAPLPVTVTGGQYSKNGGAYTSEPGTVVNGDTLRLGITSPSTPNTTVVVTLYINGISVG